MSSIPTDVPPPYSETDQQLSLARRENALQRFIAYRLAIDYELLHDLPDRDKPTSQEYSNLAGLAIEYNKLIGGQTPSLVTDARIALRYHIFEPAETIGIPADVVEFFLFSFRVISKHHGECTSALGVPLIKTAQSLFLTKLALDYRFTHKATRWIPFRDAVRRACHEMHRYCYPWMLDLGDINVPVLDQPLASFDEVDRPQWPNVFRMFVEAYRPHFLLTKDKAMPPECIIDGEAFGDWVNGNGQRRPRLIKRPCCISRPAGPPTSIMLPGGGWWWNPDTHLPRPEIEYRVVPRTSNCQGTLSAHPDRPIFALPDESDGSWRLFDGPREGVPPINQNTGQRRRPDVTDQLHAYSWLP